MEKMMTSGHGKNMYSDPDFAGTETRRHGFTLLEMLAVLAIIMILSGLMFVAARSARQRAHIDSAKSEVRELAKAWKAYRITYEKWPSFVSGDQYYAMTEQRMAILQGDDTSENPRELKFLDIDTPKWEDGYKDPWGNVYRVRFAEPDAPDAPEPEYFETTVWFPNRNRYKYD